MFLTLRAFDHSFTLTKWNINNTDATKARKVTSFTLTKWNINGLIVAYAN